MVFTFGDAPGFCVLYEEKSTPKYITSNIIARDLKNRFFLIVLPQLLIYIVSCYRDTYIHDYYKKFLVIIEQIIGNWN